MRSSMPIPSGLRTRLDVVEFDSLVEYLEAGEPFEFLDIAFTPVSVYWLFKDKEGNSLGRSQGDGVLMWLDDYLKNKDAEAESENSP